MLAGGVLAAQPAQAETFSLQLALVTPLAELRDWLRAAGPGHVATYCVGVHLPKGSDAAIAVRRWQDQGLVETLPTLRDPDGRRWQWRVRKLAQAAAGGSATRHSNAEAGFPPSTASPAPAGRPPRADCPRAVDRGALSRLLGQLRHCAERGEACPSDARLAALIGLGVGSKARARVQYMMRVLAAQRRIASETRGRNAPRVVTILAPGRAQGRSTAR